MTPLFSSGVVLCLTYFLLATCGHAATATPVALLPTVAPREMASPTPMLTHTLYPTSTSLSTRRPDRTATPTPTQTATSTRTAAPTHTSTCTATLTQTPTPTNTPTPIPPDTPTPVSATVLLGPMNHHWQTRNNCGPASVAITLGYFGHWVTQQKVNEQVPAGSLSPCDIVLYMPQYQLMARLYFSPPTSEAIRQLLDNGIPVIINQRLSSDSCMRHYRVIHGYDDTSSEFITDDPLLGPYFRIDYDTFNALSNPGNFIPVYPPEKDPLVQSLMGTFGAGEFSCP